MENTTAPVEAQRQRQIGVAISKGTLGIIIGVGAVALLTLLFLKLSDDVVENEFTSFDRSVILAIHSTTTPTQTAIMLVVTEFGKTIAGIFAGVSIVIGAYIVMQGRRQHTAGVPVAVIDALTPVFTMLGAVALSTVIKDVVARQRPHLFTPLSPEIGPSFPSGHTLVAVAFYGICAFMLARPARAWLRAIIIALAAIIIAGVAYSRVYIGVHYPTDVISSMLLGLAWLITVSLTLTAVEHHLQRAHVLKKVEDAAPPPTSPHASVERGVK